MKISSQERLGGHPERKIDISDDSISNIQNSKLIFSTTNSFEIIYPEHLSSKEIDRLEIIENWPLIKSLKKDKILLKKSYLNEYSYA